MRKRKRTLKLWDIYSNDEGCPCPGMDKSDQKPLEDDIDRQKEFELD